MRLNKFLSSKGIAARRKIDEMIEAGSILVNGQKAELGQALNEGDLIEINPDPSPENSSIEIFEKITLIFSENNNLEKIYLALNKPKGVISSCSEKNNIIDFLAEEAVENLTREEKNITKDTAKLKDLRLFPVGRLDKDSGGLILLTNDGKFANQMTHPSFEHEKEYLIKTQSPINDEFIAKIQDGIYFSKEDKTSSPCKAWKTEDKEFHIILKEGFKRQIRRMTETLGNEVKELIRIRIVNLELGELTSGHYVRIEPSELAELFNYKSTEESKDTEKIR